MEESLDYKSNIGDSELLDNLEDISQYVSVRYKTNLNDNSDYLLNVLTSNTDINYYFNKINTGIRDFNLIIKSNDGLFNFEKSINTNDIATNLEYNLVNSSKFINLGVSEILLNVVKNNFFYESMKNLDHYKYDYDTNIFESDLLFLKDINKDTILSNMIDFKYEIYFENFNSIIFLGGLHKNQYEVGNNINTSMSNNLVKNFMLKSNYEIQRDTIIEKDKNVNLNNFKLETLVKINELVGISVSKLKKMSKKQIVNLLKKNAFNYLNKSGGGMSDKIVIIITFILILYFINKKFFFINYINEI